MIKIRANEIKMDKSLHEIDIVNGSSYMVEGKKEVTVDAELTCEDYEEFQRVTEFNKPKDYLMETGNGDIWIIKDCYITGYDISMTQSGPITASIDINASDAEPAFKDVKFRDGVKNVSYKDYFKVQGSYGTPEDMTYDEFKDYVMVDNI